MIKTDFDWPALPLAAWDDTRATLQLYVQIVGKIRLAQAPMEAEWAEVPLYLTSRGLTTTPMPCGSRTFQIDFDFISHRLIIAASDGQTRTIDLLPRSVAEFQDMLMSALRELGIDVKITDAPQELPKAIPFSQDRVHASYDKEYVHRFWSILAQVDQAFKQFRAPFRGKHTPVEFFWGSFDLAYARFSGRPAQPPPGANLLFRVSGDAEQMCGGFWPGDARFPEPAFYGYAYPKIAGIEEAPIRPSSAFWSPDIGEFLLRYEDVRTAPSPRDAILEFLNSLYAAAARLANWDPWLTSSLPH